MGEGRRGWARSRGGGDWGWGKGGDRSGGGGDWGRGKGGDRSGEGWGREDGKRLEVGEWEVN